MKRVKKLTATLALWAAASLPLQAAEPVTLGLNFPRSGPYKEEGLAQMRGALLAIDKVNAQGGVLGRPASASHKCIPGSHSARSLVCQTRWGRAAAKCTACWPVPLAISSARPSAPSRPRSTARMGPWLRSAAGLC